jgi:ribosomal protein L29
MNKKIRQEMSEKNVEALQQGLEKLQRDHFDLRQKAVAEKLSNPRQLTKTRREIALFKTLIRQRELAAK